jgi:hypothetical protein
MYQENVNPSHRDALRLVVTIATLLGAGSATNLAALDTINVSYLSPKIADGVYKLSGGNLT